MFLGVHLPFFDGFLADFSRIFYGFDDFLRDLSHFCQ